MRSPKWMVAYAIGLAMVAGLYVSLVYFGPGVALIFGAAAFLAMAAALAFVILR